MNKILNVENIYIVSDKYTGKIFGLYDISRMKGSMKDFSDFDSYEEYHKDMIHRGAISVKYNIFNI